MCTFNPPSLLFSNGLTAFIYFIIRRLQPEVSVCVLKVSINRCVAAGKKARSRTFSEQRGPSLRKLILLNIVLRGVLRFLEQEFAKDRVMVIDLRSLTLHLSLKAKANRVACVNFLHKLYRLSATSFFMENERHGAPNT